MFGLLNQTEVRCDEFLFIEDEQHENCEILSDVIIQFDIWKILLSFSLSLSIYIYYLEYKKNFLCGSVT